MKIEKGKSPNTLKFGFNNGIEAKKPVPETKTVDASSQDALSSQGRALVNMSFKDKSEAEELVQMTETNVIKDSELKDFNKNINSLSLSLASLSDQEFNELTIDQEYNKDEFIKDVLDTVKDMPEDEKQKVYDYFGFELYQNDEVKAGYSIIGYPANSSDSRKLAQIDDEKTKGIIEKLRPKVIKFSENNHITCDNKDIEKELNGMAKVLPEMRTMINRVQHGTHHFDVFKHSLKVMQKITQDEKFQSLSDSDKKVMLLASVLHDITKAEGRPDHTHAQKGSIDASLIIKKFKLSKDEEIKLCDLIKHHEWLNYVNSSQNKEELDKRLKDTVYNLQYENMLDMAVMMTHADLKAVKSDDSFHDRKDGFGRKDFEGNARSFGESTDYYADKIKVLIEELKSTRPISHDAKPSYSD